MSATMADLNAKLKAIYSQPLALTDDDYIFEGQMAFTPKKYGSRVDDTAPPVEPEGLILRTSRKLPPDAVLITNDEIIRRVSLGGDQERETAEQLILQRRRQRERLEQQRRDEQQQAFVRAEEMRADMRRDLRERFPGMTAAERENTINLEMERQRVLRENTRSPERFTEFAQRQLDEAKRRLDREMRQQLIGSWDEDTPDELRRPPAPKAKPQGQVTRGKRAISFNDE